MNFSTKICNTLFFSLNAINATLIRRDYHFVIIVHANIIVAVITIIFGRT